MTTTTTALRYYGRCLVRSCRHRAVIDQHSSTALVTSHSSTGRPCLAIQDTDGAELPLNYTERAQIAAHVAAGLACPTHRRPLQWKRGQFTMVPEQVCNGSCTHATGTVCECACGGANHGDAHLIH